jgi:hypothetical protein
VFDETMGLMNGTSTTAIPTCPPRPALLWALLLLILPTFSIAPIAAWSFDWVPSQEEIDKYRQSWNPLSHGPILLPAVDISPKGQFLVHPFIFSQTGNQQFGNRLSVSPQAASARLSAVLPLVIAGYGISDHVEIEGSLSAVWWENRPRGAHAMRDSEAGVGDTSMWLKYRPVIQDPDGWRPSVTTMSMIGLPTSDYADTRSIPGGFAPLGRLPVTRFGALTFTEGLLVRKNLQPFRISAGVFYSHSLPGRTTILPGEAMAETGYAGDLINTRLVVEHMLDDDRGFGYNVEFVSLHGLAHRLDGHAVNVQPATFNLFGVQPTIQYRFTPNQEGGQLVAAAGVLLTVAGQNSINAIYPNISLYYYWAPKGRVQMR